jgi:hypothetical protein
LQLKVRLAAGPLRGRQQHLVELARVEDVADRRGAVGIADDRLAQLEPGPAQAGRGALGTAEGIGPAAGEVDRLGGVARGQRRDQQRVGDLAPAGVPAQRGNELRVLVGAGGNDQRLLSSVVIVCVHLGLLWSGRW